MIRLTASSFELASNSARQQSLSGYVCVDDNNPTSFQALKELCSRDAVDQVVVVYREYAFLLTQVSFSDNDRCQGADRTFKFHAKDVHLEGLVGSLW